MTIMMMINVAVVSLLNVDDTEEYDDDHNYLDHDHDLQDAGPLGWLLPPQSDLHGVSVPSCQPGQD